MIRMSNLSVDRDKRRVVSDFSAEFLPSTITAIVGANGSGKSTIIGALAGDLPYQGSITINGAEVSSLSDTEQAEARSVVQQNHSYWLAFTSREILELGMNEKAKKSLPRIVDSLDMTSYLEQSVTTLSGGQLQRIDIARALMVDRDVMLLDEPLSAQDLNSRQKIIEILKRLRDSGKTIVVVAHLDSAELSWCDQIINLSQ